MLIRATAMRIDWPVLAALLLPPVGVMLLVGRNNDVQIVRSMSLLAICSGQWRPCRSTMKRTLLRGACPRHTGAVRAPSD